MVFFFREKATEQRFFSPVELGATFADVGENSNEEKRVPFLIESVLSKCYNARSLEFGFFLISRQFSPQ